MFTHYDIVHTHFDIVHTHFDTGHSMFTQYDTVHTHFDIVHTHFGTSSLSSIHLVSIAKSSIIQKYGIDKILEPFMADIKELKGVYICI